MDVEVATPDQAVAVAASVAAVLAGSLPSELVVVAADGHEVRVIDRGGGGSVTFRFEPGTWMAGALYVMVDQLQTDISEWSTEPWPAGSFAADGATSLHPFVERVPGGFEIGFQSDDGSTPRVLLGVVRDG